MKRCKHPNLVIEEEFHNYAITVLDRDGVALVRMDVVQGDSTDRFRFRCKRCGMDKVFIRGSKNTSRWAARYIERIVDGDVE